ncbi:MAG TPA: capsular biosynthesis protein [Clostridium sp.]|nr:capsular biosynthesis protein [Clostridium sp.]
MYERSGGKTLEERVIEIGDVFKILKKRLVLIISFTVIATALASFISFYAITPQYVSSTKLFIGKEVAENQKYSANDIQVYQKLLNTYSEILTTNDLIDKAVKNNDIELSPGAVISGLTVAPKADTQIINISFRCSDPELSRNTLNALTSEFVNESQKLIPDGNVKVIQKANLPMSPASPNKTKNIAIGFLAGLMLGILVAFFIEYINNTVLSAEELEEILDVPVIGKIPVES